MTARFILWDPRDGYPRFDAEVDPPKCVSDGLLGRVGADNVYLTVYAEYPDEKRPQDLEIGQAIAGVGFSLSGGKGSYDIVRVADADGCHAEPALPESELKGPTSDLHRTATSGA